MSTSETTYDAIPEPRVVPSHFFLQTPLSVLHELFSRCGLACEYDVISRPSGHCADFVMQASVANLKATGKGCTKRAAKQSAIVHLLKALFRCSGTGSKADVSPGGNTSSSAGDSFPNSAVDALQKFCDANQWTTPTYHAVSRTSTDQGDFVVTCVVKNTAVTGTGTSKKLAKKHAAFKMLFYQLSCVHSKSCRENSGKKSKRGEPASNPKLKPERSESGKKKAKKVSRVEETCEGASCSASEEKGGECDAAKSTTSEMNSELSFDGSESADSSEPRKQKTPPDVRIKNSQLGGAANGRKSKGKQTLNKEKLAPEDARQWLSTLLLKNMNLNHPQRIIKPNNSDNSDLGANNRIVCQTTTSSMLRNAAGADAESALAKFPISEQIYQFDDVVSSEEAIPGGDELRDPASEPIPKLPPLPANSIAMTRSLPEFSPEFLEDAILALPQSLSFENQAQKSESEQLKQCQEETTERSSGGSSNEAAAAPVCVPPRCLLAGYMPRFTWVESDMVVLERYAWGTSVYMLPRFLAAVVLVVELLLGLLYLCTDHVSSTELLYTFLVLIFLMFLLRAS